MKDPFGKMNGVKVMMEEPLSHHTTFRIGGAAQYFVFISSKKALDKVIKVIAKRKMQYFVIGAGTNLLVADQGFRGVILKLGGAFKRMTMRNGHCACGSGMLIDDLLDQAAEKGYGGLEFMAGIPGTLGGAVKGNAGAFGGSISDHIESVELIDESGELCRRSKEELGFSYRASRITDTEIITSVNLVMKKQQRTITRRRIKKNLMLRKTKHPSGYSAGSFFKNLDVVSSEPFFL